MNGDTSAVLTTQPTCSTTYTTASAAGSSPPTSCSGAAAANYSFSYVAGSVTVGKATPTITWATPAAISYGTALSAAQLNASSATAGSFVYTPAAGTVLAAGTQTLSVTLNPTDSTDYNPATQTVSLTVNKATPTITWATPAAIPYGTALSATQLNASSTTAGSFVYTPASGTVLAAGTQTLSVTLNPTDSADYNPATQTVSLTVNKATPTITWATPAAISYGTALSATQLNAGSATPGSFVYTPASGTVLSAGTQTLSVTLNPTDSADYNPATQTVSLTVSQAVLTITASSPAVTYGASVPTITASYSGFVNGDTGAVLTTQPTCSTTYTTASAAGSSPPTSCSGAAAANYTMSYVAGTVTVGKASLTITASSPAVSYGASVPTITPSYSGFVNGDTSAVLTTQPTCSTTYTASSGAGTSPPTSCSGAAAVNYSISYVAGAVTVGKAPLTITASSPAVSYGASVPTISASYSGFMNGDTSAVLTTQPTCSTTYTASSAAGSSPPASCSGAAAANYTISYVAGSVTVGKAVLTITASSPVVSYGASVPTITASYSGFMNGDTSAVLTAQPTCSTTYTTASAAGSSPPTSCSGAAAANYTISYVAGSVTVGKATPTITWATPAAISYGTALSATQLNASSATAGSFVYTPASGAVLAAGTQTLSVTLNPTDSTDYNPATQTVSLTVNKATPTITWATPAAIPYGTALGATQLNASSTTAGSFVYTPASGTVLAAGTQTLSVTLNPTDSADYNPATQTVSLPSTRPRPPSPGPPPHPPPLDRRSAGRN